MEVTRFHQVTSHSESVAGCDSIPYIMHRSLQLRLNDEARQPEATDNQSWCEARTEESQSPKAGA